jgi:hypothetical protein
MYLQKCHTMLMLLAPFIVGKDGLVIKVDKAVNDLSRLLFDSVPKNCEDRAMGVGRLRKCFFLPH